MKAKDLIKEIDPDYYRCTRCKRLIHKSKVERWINSGETKIYLTYCLDDYDCEAHRYRMDKLNGSSGTN